MLASSNAAPAFTEKGFSNWENAMQKKKGFQKQESSDSHVKAVARYVMAPAVIDDIRDLLSEHASEKNKNWKILLSILSNIRYLTRQALPFRGDWNTETLSMSTLYDSICDNHRIEYLVACLGQAVYALQPANSGLWFKKNFPVLLRRL